MHHTKRCASAAMLGAGFAALVAAAPAAARDVGENRGHGCARADFTGKRVVYDLETAAQRLHEAIHSTSLQGEGASREHASSAVNRALLATTQAMLKLPAEYRTETSSGDYFAYPPVAPPRPIGPTYEQSMQHLQAASERLDSAAHAMARDCNSSRLDAAIQEVNGALAETHAAVGWVFDQRLTARTSAAATAASPRGSTMSHAGGAGRAGGPAATVAADTHAIAGGVGINSRARLSGEAAHDHNVKMVFALDSGNYVADVDVKVIDRSGRPVIGGVANGPWLYAQLPPGTYTAQATYLGATVSEKFTIGRKGVRTAIFRWPASIEHAPAGGVAPILGTGPQAR